MITTDTEILLDKSLSILRTIRDDRQKLERLLDFMEKEFMLEKKDETELTNYNDLLPDRYRKIVREIADNLNSNFISYYNPDTLEVEYFPKNLLYEGESCSGDDEDNPFRWNRNRWDECIKFAPLGARATYDIMTNFVNRLSDGTEKTELTKILDGRKSYVKFNQLILKSACKDDWFVFKQKSLEKYVIDKYFRKYINSD
jgi:hypothetical protein